MKIRNNVVSQQRVIINKIFSTICTCCHLLILILQLILLVYVIFVPVQLVLGANIADVEKSDLNPSPFLSCDDYYYYGSSSPADPISIKKSVQKLIPEYNADLIAIELGTDGSLVLKPSDPAFAPFLTHYYYLAKSFLRRENKSAASASSETELTCKLFLLTFNHFYLDFLDEVGIPLACFSLYSGATNYSTVAQVRRLGEKLGKHFRETPRLRYAPTKQNGGRYALFPQLVQLNGRDVLNLLEIESVAQFNYAPDLTYTNCQNFFWKLQNGDLLAHLPTITTPPFSIIIPSQEESSVFISTERSNVTFLLEQYFSRGLDCLYSPSLKGNFSSTFADWISVDLVPRLLKIPICIRGFSRIFILLKSIDLYSMDLKNLTSENAAAGTKYSASAIEAQQQQKQHRVRRAAAFPYATRTKNPMYYSRRQPYKRPQPLRPPPTYYSQYPQQSSFSNFKMEAQPLKAQNLDTEEELLRLHAKLEELFGRTGTRLTNLDLIQDDEHIAQIVTAKPRPTTTTTKPTTPKLFRRRYYYNYNNINRQPQKLVEIPLKRNQEVVQIVGASKSNSRVGDLRIPVQKQSSLVGLNADEPTGYKEIPFKVELSPVNPQLGTNEVPFKLERDIPGLMDPNQDRSADIQTQGQNINGQFYYSGYQNPYPGDGFGFAVQQPWNGFDQQPNEDSYPEEPDFHNNLPPSPPFYQPEQPHRPQHYHTGERHQHHVNALDLNKYIMRKRFGQNTNDTNVVAEAVENSIKAILAPILTSSATRATKTTDVKCAMTISRYGFIFMTSFLISSFF